MLSVAFNLAFDVIKTKRLAAALHYLIKHNTHKNIHHIYGNWFFGYQYFEEPGLTCRAGDEAWFGKTAYGRICAEFH